MPDGQFQPQPELNATGSATAAPTTVAQTIRAGRVLRKFRTIFSSSTGWDILPRVVWHALLRGAGLRGVGARRTLDGAAGAAQHHRRRNGYPGDQADGETRGTRLKKVPNHMLLLHWVGPYANDHTPQLRHNVT